MAAAASDVASSTTSLRAERRLGWLLRAYGLVFAAAAVLFLLRPDATVVDVDRLGALLRLPTLPPSPGAVASDFWHPLAVADMAALTACCWLAAGNVRVRRALAWPVVVALLAAAATAALLFVRWTHALPFLLLAVVSLLLAGLLVRALRRARVVA
jgi:hypothetical protein